VTMPTKKTVLTAVDRELAQVAKRDKDLAAGALAATAQALARELDDQDTSATAKAACARELTATMSQIRNLAPKNERQDALDEIGARRAKRRARGAGA
jgi:hypothetical protein